MNAPSGMNWLPKTQDAGCALGPAVGTICGWGVVEYDGDRAEGMTALVAVNDGGVGVDGAVVATDAIDLTAASVAIAFSSAARVLGPAAP